MYPIKQQQHVGDRYFEQHRCGHHRRAPHVPSAAAVNPSGSKVFVTLSTPNAVGVIDTGTNTLIGTIPVCMGPYQPVVNGAARGFTWYVPSGNVSVVDSGEPAPWWPPFRSAPTRAGLR